MTTNETLDQQSIKENLEAKLNQVSQEAYRAGYTSALLAALKPIKETISFLQNNVASAEQYLKNELSEEELQELQKSVDESAHQSTTESSS